MPSSLATGGTPKGPFATSSCGFLRRIRALNDAMKWRRLQNKKLAATKGEPQKTVVKAGAKRRAGDGEAAARKKQQQKLRKSGRIEDALGLMLKP